MVKGTFPFAIARPSDRLFKMMRDGNWEDFWKKQDKATRKPSSPEFRTLIEGMLAEDPVARWDMDKVANSAFLSSHQAFEIAHN